MADIKREEMSWLVEPYLPFGKISIVQGDPGTGKTTVMLAIAAALTSEGELPNGTIAEPANVIFQTAEDGLADTIKPRLEDMGADCSRVDVIDESGSPLSFSDERIEQAIIQTGAKLFIADPLQGFCQGSDMNSVGGIRPLMAKLGAVAERTGCAVVLISHLRKSGGQSAYRGLGSIDIYAAARSVLTVGKLPLDENMRAIVHTKSNLSSFGKSQAFGLDENGGFCWLGDCDATVDEVMSGKPKPESQFAKARRLLETKLKNGAVPAIEIMQMADDEGISFKTFKRAKDALGVISIKRSGQWYWDLPVEVVYEEAGQISQEGQATNTLVPLDYYASESS
jgi:DNA polymerase III delta prime subunit